MYNEELESLIDAALADGVLTEKEKQILFKKAQAMGVDLDEFEMVLDARLVKLKKAEKAKESAPKSNKLGDVKKCPNCGAVVQSFQGVCPECGYAFEGVDANASVRKLSEDLVKKKDYEKKMSVIQCFPIPNTKTDLIELISFIQTHLSSIDDSSSGARAYRKACQSKLQECFLKAKLLFPKDEQLATLSQEVDVINKKDTNKRNTKNTLRIIGGILLILIGLFVGWKIWLLDWSYFWRVVTIMYTAGLLCIGGIELIIIPILD